MNSEHAHWVKRVDTRTYRKTIKRIVQAAKSLRGLARMPAPLPRPGSPAYRYPKIIDGKDHKATKGRMDQYEELDSVRMDRAVAHYYAEQAMDTR